MTKSRFERRISLVISLILWAGLAVYGYPFSSEDITDIVQPTVSPNSEPAPAVEPAPGVGLPSDTGIPALVRRLKPSVGAIVTFTKDGIESQGSGVFVSSQGEFLTNHHVVEGAASAEVKLFNGKIYPVKAVLATCPGLDLVKLKVGEPGEVFTPANVALSVPVTGERLFTIGNPMGLEASVADGLVSGYRDDPEEGRMMQISVPISPGSSGGPLFNLKGQLVGIATYHIKGQNLNFAVPVDRFRTLRPLPMPITLAQWNHLPELRATTQGLDLAHKAATEIELGNYSAALNYLEQLSPQSPGYTESLLLCEPAAVPQFDSSYPPIP